MSLLLVLLYLRNLFGKKFLNKKNFSHFIFKIEYLVQCLKEILVITFDALERLKLRTLLKLKSQIQNIIYFSYFK